jgi:cyclic beta-1,2-glucan synthetase
MPEAQLLAPHRCPPLPDSLQWDDDVPIRGELCGAEQLRALARQVARASPTRAHRRGRPLLRRLEENRSFLLNTHRIIGEAARNQETLTPDAEWLLDNFYVIRDVLDEVREHLPRAYYEELPVRAGGPFDNWPRVYALAVALVAHTDSSLDEAQMLAFVRAYQQEEALTIGELWAIPTMLRLVLLENLRRLSAQMLEARRDRAHALAWAEPVAGIAPPPLPEEPRDAFMVALLQALRDHPSTDPAVQEWLARHAPDTAEALRREHRRQAANQVSVGNAVTSLRLLEALDWPDFFERASLVEEVLCAEPAGAYGRQDFSTRDRYRREVELLAKRSGHDELDVARRVVDRARRAEGDPRRGHVGWYLIGDGRGEFESELGYRPQLGERWRRFLRRHPNTVYFGMVSLFIAVIVAAAVLLAGAGSSWALWVVVLVVLLPASEWAVSLTNYLVCQMLPPRVLPKLDFKDGVPPDCMTFVVVPGMLFRPESAAHLLERLELHYLANPDPQLHFALLTDFADAPAEHMPEDDALLEAALAGVRRLNERYAADQPERFFLFHRRRLWNPSEKCWMGWERKRGKLHEFNRLLRGATDTGFVVRSTTAATLPHARFVITLDADTVLPKEVARQLVSTLAHPLNRAVLSDDGRRVVAGYGIIQPRVNFLYRTGMRSWFARVFARSAGVDPYSSAVSDVYQDLFGRATFTGKGIYDVDAFEATAGPAFPEYHILSHDLIESNFARCGLATDIELFDDFPARYHAYARREHRWARGDWQLLPWLGRLVPVPTNEDVIGWRISAVEGAIGSTTTPPPDPTTPAKRAHNVLPLLERWKVLDNLRRSLVPPALVLSCALGWTVLPGTAWGWTLFVLSVLAIPLFLQLHGSIRSFFLGTPGRAVLRQARTTLTGTAGQIALVIAFLLHQAGLMLDAIVRTLHRIYVSRRHLLEWETAAATERRLGIGLWQFVRTMWACQVLAVALGILVGWLAPSSLAVALPLLLLWFFSPLIAYLVSRPLPHKEPPLSEAAQRTLRTAARRTWHFFETFVGPEDNFLPPDNYQEDPKGEVAHRTSPTNIGLMTLSTLAAHDLGYVTLPDMARRLGSTFDTLSELERHQGHFLNWYDTTSLRPLPPAYVSTVDSGNLAACLWVLERGLLEKRREPVPSRAGLTGLQDGLDVLAEELGRIGMPVGAPDDVWRKLASDAADLRVSLDHVPADLVAWRDLFRRLEAAAAGIAAQARGLGDMLAATPEGVIRWAGTLVEEARRRGDELHMLAPWVGLIAERSAEAADDAGWKPLCAELLAPRSVAELEDKIPAWVAAVRRDMDSDWKGRLADDLDASAAFEWSAQLRELAKRAEDFSAGMNFRFLYNPERNLFAVGFNAATGQLDQAHYDLLASEACLTSFLAIARGEVPRKHWFQLGRLTTRVDGMTCLVSWGGTMFEYLMPRLFLPTPRGTLLDTAHRAAVARQVEYGHERKVPWGISESGFYFFDAALNYQYQSFGVPGLGLKRGLQHDLVVAPYATLLAVSVDPEGAVANLARLRAEDGYGRYGFYEAIDFTPSRLPKGRRHEVVRSYMAHHQGMGLLAIANRLTGDRLQRRLLAEPRVRAVELLLQERIPYEAPLVQTTDEEDGPRHVAAAAYPVARRITSPHTPAPRTHLLSNGHYSVLVTNAGAGCSTWRGLDVTRWREDRTLDASGQFIYIRDRHSGKVWSAGFQPTRVQPEFFEVLYSIDKAEFRRVDDAIETVMEVAVTPEKNVEVRRLAFRNLDSRPRELEVISYAELVLNPHGADLAHPAFGKLFLETEWLPGSNALLCRRRPRSPDQKPAWAVHTVAFERGDAGPTMFETDRARFLGRRRTPADPVALQAGVELSGTVGPVLDPVFSLSRRVRLGPNGRAVIAFSTGVADTREEALAIADQYHTLLAVTRAFELAWAHSRVELYSLNLTVEDAHLYQRLLGHVLFPPPALRASSKVLSANTPGQAGLWRHGISGDLAIFAARVADAQQLPLVRQLLAAHAYWRGKGFRTDLLILNEDPSGYFEDFQGLIMELIRSHDAREWIDRPGGVFVRKTKQMTLEDRNLLQSAARVLLAGDQGMLGSQIDVMDRPKPLPARVNRRIRRERLRAAPTPPGDGLQFFNGFGGFSADGREYVITASDAPPAPWSNIVANEDFGFLITEGGSGFTWAGNSQLNRLTTWSNDPVSDPPGEALYIRDEATGVVWSPTPLPVRDGTPTTVRHGAGYTVFEQRREGLEQELTLFCSMQDPVKFWRLKVRNIGSQPRLLSTTLYLEWVLGVNREQTDLYVVTEEDSETGALFARNTFSMDFGGAVAFADVSLRPRTITGDRTEFLGRNGTAAAPAALERVELSGRVGTALDPCGAVQAKFSVPPGEERVVVFLLGQASDSDGARRLVEQYRQPEATVAALHQASHFWDGILGTIQVKTPEPAADMLLNRWLLYQTTACRYWGRSAFYQSGGAYGYRDQLQDVMALVYSAPQETRAHILRSARRQFVQGDVQHWWHPPSGRGIRTRFSDDFLWLPFVVCHYLRVTGDVAILEERLPFLDAPPLGADQEEVYGLPSVSDKEASLYEHCVRALDWGWKLGPHGLPLMGTGDWNDGMNKVGAGGKGESVWVAWFQIAILRAFAPVAQAHGDADRAKLCLERAAQLRWGVEEHAWDGNWYLRAYFDDGTALGSARNTECQIDSLPQTWAVISGAGEPERSRSAMEAVRERLIRLKEKIILLFDPPFDQGPLQPGYIKGYVPGIRENGGQYTHAATWTVLAEALLGRGTEAQRLFALLNPVRNAQSAADVQTYKVEPYVIAADVYGRPPHVGRGGWTWYTGSASWFYRLGIETLLGFQKNGDELRIDPCIPSEWPRFSVHYRHGSTHYEIEVENPKGVERGVVRLEVDGKAIDGGPILLADDGQAHRVLVEMG